MDTSDGSIMRYGLLGPVEVLRGATALDLGPRQRRVLLTRLLVQDGHPVSLAEICRDLWEGDQPRAAASSVRAHVSRLRSALDPGRQGRSDVLVSSKAGYALRIPPEARDTTAFEESILAARTALRQGHLERARQRLDQALGLWRGPALGEAADHAFALREKARLNAARQDARELQVTVLIKQADFDRAVPTATRLTADAPLRETSWALLMRALYAAGRPAQSLREYERFRALLARELGLDPSPGLRDLHMAVLRHDADILGPVLGAPGPHRLTTAPSPPVPTGPPLVGRAEETAQLDGLLRAVVAGGTQWAVVSGEAGSGKTRLLDELAARAAEAGLRVVRVRGGRSGADGQGAAPSCPVVRLLDELRRREPEESGLGAEAATRPDPVEALAHELGRAPVLCQLDDLDEVGPESCTRLRRLAGLLRDTPAAVVCALRDTGTPQVSGLLADLARQGTAWLRLEPLATEDVAELLTVRNEDPVEAEALNRRAAGNPFVLAELLRLPPGRRTGPGARVPSAVGTIVHDRVAGVSAEARSVLVHTAVDGGRLDLGLLAELPGTSPDRLPTLVDDAVTAGLLVWHPDRSDPLAGHYQLPELVHEVLLGTLTPSGRQLLHSALARALTDREAADPARLAGHLRAAGPLVPVLPAALRRTRTGAGTDPSGEH
ncbi:AAA family ATPase [Streptomyces sp. NBC_00654]|uniref:BTAD domain-containing putative transcriptional regulator n=1 Tax=Streptomyces sp. NBC_00654 TaxID=2975799 RepID=UPI00224CF6EB|nr:BTAD domain-containing putative transcriptional regulator [Streptomyces sp. NBC_00654]MCX4966936.1 AAA family ATPase [Streptomyces sp. NBC_00654]